MRSFDTGKRPPEVHPCIFTSATVSRTVKMQGVNCCALLQLPQNWLSRDLHNPLKQGCRAFTPKLKVRQSWHSDQSPLSSLLSASLLGTQFRQVHKQAAFPKR